jgi:NADH-quinone oxidoreductase subunit F
MEQPLKPYVKEDKATMTLKEYEKAGGYETAKMALNDMKPEEITEMVQESNLKGRGGAGFPTGMKFSFMPMGDDVPRPKYLVVNADEMEPGTFKDRLLLESTPHQLIEACIISAYALDVDVCYNFLRWAYKTSAKTFQKATEEAYDAGYLG